MVVSRRRELVYLTKLAEQSQRYEEMVENMKELSLYHTELSPEERSLVSSAYKNTVGERRSSWRTLASVERKQEKRGHRSEFDMARDYRIKLEDELERICLDCVETCEKHLLPFAVSSEAKIFFNRMLGDYHRYLAEFANYNQRRISKDASLEAYRTACDLAPQELPRTHPLRLGLALSFAVYYYEIQEDQQRACQLAKQTYDEALPEMESISEEHYKESTLLMQLLRDNYELWTEEMEEGRGKYTGYDDDDDY